MGLDGCLTKDRFRVLLVVFVVIIAASIACLDVEALICYVLSIILQVTLLLMIRLFTRLCVINVNKFEPTVLCYEQHNEKSTIK